MTCVCRSLTESCCLMTRSSQDYRDGGREVSLCRNSGECSVGCLPRRLQGPRTLGPGGRAGAGRALEAGGRLVWPPPAQSTSRPAATAPHRSWSRNRQHSWRRCCRVHLTSSYLSTSPLYLTFLPSPNYLVNGLILHQSAKLVRGCSNIT